MIKVLTIHATLSDNKAFYSRYETTYEKETEKQYRKKHSVQNKNELLTVRTFGGNSFSHISFYTYCLPCDESKAFEIVKEAVIKRYDELVAMYEKTKEQMELFKQLPTPTN